MLRVGLTGNIGSGKSTVAAIWAGLGAQVVSADVLARRAVESGAPALDAIARAFGRDVIRPDGTLDRAALRARVFRDAGARDRLEAILHPEIARLRALEERRLRDAGVDIVVFEIPLLFEADVQDEVDVIVLVDAPRAERLERVVATRGIDVAEAERMEGAQHDPVRKRERADIIIDNDGTLEELEEAAERAWHELQRRGAGSA